MLVTISLINKDDKPSIDNLFKMAKKNGWDVVKIHEIENIVLSETEGK